MQLKHLGVHLHGLDMRDTYTNSIINDNDGVILKTKWMVSAEYADKTVENVFHGVDMRDVQWCCKLINNKITHGR